MRHVDKLYSIYYQSVRIPHGERLKDIVEGFETCWGFPLTAGAIDGTHILIIWLQHSPADCYNQKGYCSILMQGLVDYHGIFMDVYAGWPGKVHDAPVFTDSDIYEKEDGIRYFQTAP